PPTGATGISGNVVLAVAALIFAVVLIVVLSAALDELIFRAPLTDTAFWKAPVFASTHDIWLSWEWGAIAGWTAFIAFIALGSGYFVNINRFSLHALYRNRIIRAFLGAANLNRKPNPFTDFDEADNIRMYELWPES